MRVENVWKNCFYVEHRNGEDDLRLARNFEFIIRLFLVMNVNDFNVEFVEDFEILKKNY